MKLEDYLQKIEDLEVYLSTDEFNKNFKEVIDRIQNNGFSIDCWIEKFYLKIQFNDTKIYTYGMIRDIETITNLAFAKAVIEDDKLYFFFKP